VQVARAAIAEGRALQALDAYVDASRRHAPSEVAS
jgi:hypothetical protein